MIHRGAARQPRYPLCALAFFVLAVCILAGCRPTPPAEKPVDIDALRSEIRSIEFINDLSPSREQIERLIDALEKVDATLQATRETRKATEAELLPLLQQRRKALIAGEDVSEEVKRGIVALETRLDGEPWLGAGGESALAKELRGILSEDQLRIASGAGQARADALEMLDGFRSLTQEDFDAEIGPFAANLAADSKGLTANQIEALFREARTFSDDEYATARVKMAEQLEPAFLPVGETADWLLAQSFADPHILPLLREKAAAMDRASG